MIWPCSATSPHHLPGAGALGPIPSLDSPPSPVFTDLESPYTSPSLSTPEFGLEHQHSGALLQSLLPELYAWADSLQAVQFPETATGPSDTASGASSGDAALPARQSGQDVAGELVNWHGLSIQHLERCQ